MKRGDERLQLARLRHPVESSGEPQARRIEIVDLLDEASERAELAAHAPVGRGGDGHGAEEHAREEGGGEAAQQRVVTRGDEREARP